MKKRYILLAIIAVIIGATACKKDKEEGESEKAEKAEKELAEKRREILLLDLAAVNDMASDALNGYDANQAGIPVPNGEMPAYYKGWIRQLAGQEFKDKDRESLNDRIKLSTLQLRFEEVTPRIISPLQILGIVEDASARVALKAHYSLEGTLDGRAIHARGSSWVMQAECPYFVENISGKQGRKTIFTTIEWSDGVSSISYLKPHTRMERMLVVDLDRSGCLCPWYINLPPNP